MTSERRTTRRVRFCGGVLPPAARVHPGREVIIVDLSSDGALVEGMWRLRPGARIELQLDSGVGRSTVRGRVERCYVASLSDPSGVRYRAALRFDAPVDFTPPADLLAGYSVPAEGTAASWISGNPIPAGRSRAQPPRGIARKRT